MQAAGNNSDVHLFKQKVGKNGIKSSSLRKTTIDNDNEILNGSSAIEVVVLMVRVQMGQGVKFYLNKTQWYR